MFCVSLQSGMVHLTDRTTSDRSDSTILDFVNKITISDWNPPFKMAAAAAVEKEQ